MSEAESIPKRRAVIHIGAPKTGTTSIPEYLALNRETMRPLGFAFPQAPGKRTHARLAFNVVQASSGTMAGLEHLRAELGSEIARLPASVHTVLLSAEHLSGKISSVREAGILREFLDTWFDQYRVILYMRRQDELAVSRYSTQLRAGRSNDRVLPSTEGILPQYDFRAILECFGAAFGQEALCPRIFARDAFTGGDLLADFRDATGLPDLPHQPPKAMNSSINGAAQEFVRRLNTVREDDAGGEHEKIPHQLRGILNDHFAGQGRRPSRAEALAYYESYKEPNEAVRRIWFPQRAALFSEDFSRYPEESDPLPSDSEVLAVAMTVVAEQFSGVNAAKRLLRRAESAARDGLKREALRFLERALDAAPTDVDALGRLVELADDRLVRRAAARRLSAAMDAAPGDAAIAALFDRLEGSRGAGPSGGDAASGQPDDKATRLAGTPGEEGATALSPGRAARMAARREARRRARASNAPDAAPSSDLTPEERRARRRQREERRVALAAARGEAVSHKDDRGASRKGRPGGSRPDRPG